MKKIKLKITKKLIVIILLIISILFLTLRIKLNNKLIKDLSINKYDYKISTFLKSININEKYIIYYNTGNLYYNEKKYTLAITEYEKSLKYNIPNSRVCKVRINLGLAKLANIPEDATTDELESEVTAIISILDGDDCSTDDYDAKTFKEELEEQLPNNQSSSNGTDDDEDENNDGNDEEELEEQLEQIQQQAQSTQEQETSESQNISDYSYYSGHKW